MLEAEPEDAEVVAATTKNTRADDGIRTRDPHLGKVSSRSTEIAFLDPELGKHISAICADLPQISPPDGRRRTKFPSRAQPRGAVAGSSSPRKRSAFSWSGARLRSCGVGLPRPVTRRSWVPTLRRTKTSPHGRVEPPSRLVRPCLRGVIQHLWRAYSAWRANRWVVELRDKLQVSYLMCTPEMARAMINLWISLVPSKMV